MNSKYWLDKVSQYKFELASLLVITIAVFALYAPSLKNGFVSDDQDQIVNNPQIQSLSNIPKAFTSCISENFLGGVCKGQYQYYRPLHTLSVMLTYAISHSPYLFHLVSIVFYILVNFLVLLFLYRLFKDKLAAVLGTAFFVLYPAHAEAVMWISVMPELLMGIFVLLTLLAHISKWDGRKWLTAEFFFLALLSKETAIVIPLILISYDYLFDGRRFNKELLKEYIPHAAALGIYLLLRISAIGLIYRPDYSFMHVSFADKFIAAVTAFGLYLKKVFYPYPFSPLIGIDLSGPSHEIRFVIGGIVLVSLLVLVTRLFVSRRYKFLGFGLVGYLLFLALPIAAMFLVHTKSELFVADRYLFMPILGAAVVFGYYTALLFRKLSRSVLFVFILALAALSVYAIKSVYVQSDVWYSNKTFAEYLHNVNLTYGIAAVRTDLGLAAIYRQGGNIPEAAELYRALISQKETFQPLVASLAANGLGEIAYQGKDFNQAVYFFRDAMLIFPNNTIARDNLRLLEKETGVR